MDFLRALLVLVPIWWMYAGYAWLTNNVRVTRQMRLVPFAVMAGFLTMAMAIPEAFGAGALTFGLSYLFVVVLYVGAFALSTGRTCGGRSAVADPKGEYSQYGIWQLTTDRGPRKLFPNQKGNSCGR